MTEGALHSTAVLFPALVANQAKAPTPLGQPRLIRAAMAKGARSDVSQLRHVIVFRVISVAEATVYRGRMMEAVTSEAALLLYGHGRGYMAGVTTEPHGQMGCDRNHTPGGSRKCGGSCRTFPWSPG